MPNEKENIRCGDCINFVTNTEWVERDVPDKRAKAGTIKKKFRVITEKCKAYNVDAKPDKVWGFCPSGELARLAKPAMIEEN